MWIKLSLTIYRYEYRIINSINRIFFVMERVFTKYSTPYQKHYFINGMINTSMQNYIKSTTKRLYEEF